jgi:GDPmannose 4,6-dehydratase
MNARPRAVITGVSGQDGSYLAELLLEKGYQVFATVRNSRSSREHIVHLESRLEFVPVDFSSLESVEAFVKRVQPCEFYNLGAQSFVPQSWEDPLGTCEANAMAVVRILEAIRRHSPRTRYFQASSATMYGECKESPQTERTPFEPTTPYASSKVFAHHCVENYRKKHRLFAVSGILFNHESPRRGADFVTQKIASGAARIKLGLQSSLSLGCLDARRDWGFAGDYVRAMWLMLQASGPEDFVIASGTTHSVRDVLKVAFSYLDLEWEQYVAVDQRFVRNREDVLLVGDASKAREKLGWIPHVSFEKLIEDMVQAQMEKCQLDLQSACFSN